MPEAAELPWSSEITPNSTLKIYPGAPHGLTGAHEDEFNKDLLAFLTL